MIRMVNSEKINIYVPDETGRMLKRDAELFEVYRQDGREINLNRFLSRLIVGYYNGYKREWSDGTGAIRGILTPYLQDRDQRDAAAREIMEKVVLPPAPRRKGPNPLRLSLKPTRETDQILTEIRSNMSPHAALSQELCRMFMSYCVKPIYERERMIFRSRFEFLEEACREGRCITFALTTHPEAIRHVMPYAVVAGSEEMFNYLLCQEYDSLRERNEAKSYRLCRIHHPAYDHAGGGLEERVKTFLEKMRQTAPQFAIGEDVRTRVYLTAAGRRSFQKIYTFRPVPDRVEENPEDGSAVYEFSCSTDQIYRYLLRFNAGEAVVLEPAEVKERLRNYYLKALESLVQGGICGSAGGGEGFEGETEGPGQTHPG